MGKKNPETKYYEANLEHERLATFWVFGLGRLILGFFLLTQIKGWVFCPKDLSVLHHSSWYFDLLKLFFLLFKIFIKRFFLMTRDTFFVSLKIYTRNSFIKQSKSKFHAERNGIKKTSSKMFSFQSSFTANWCLYIYKIIIVFLIRK